MDHVSRTNSLEMEFVPVVTEIWCEVLEVAVVGAEDNFFDIGGHSLLLQMVQERVVQRTGRNVEMIEFFTHPTVRSFARHLAGDGGSDAGAGRRRPTGRVNRLGSRRAQIGGDAAANPGENRD